MTLSESVARLVMGLATARPPPERALWALAMQREFEALDEGRLTWALGCFTTTAGWRLRAEWPYLALLAVAPVVGTLAVNLITLPLFNLFGARSAIAPLFFVAGPAVVAFALGAYRPRRIGLTAVGVMLFMDLPMEVGAPGWWLTPKSTLFMAPPLIGLLAGLAVCYVGALMGARTAGLARRA